MLFTDNLEDKVFSTHQYINCDELVIISAYIGPSPVKRLAKLPIRTTVIYGMYGSDSISYKLHNALVRLHSTNKNEILYSNIPVHSKCYIWKKNGKIIYALIGSANFSTSGLTIPFRESLAETTSGAFIQLSNYLQQIISNSIPIDSVNSPPKRATAPTRFLTSSMICDMVLYDPRTNEVPSGSGLNWGFSQNGHNKPGDAYIAIRTSHIRDFPNLFPPKQTHPANILKGKKTRQNDAIELIWDDGTIMEALLEGSQPVYGVQYPKQLSSSEDKNILGVYVRKRLGLSSAAFVTKADLDSYGRDYISISLLQNGTYYADFSI